MSQSEVIDLLENLDKPIPGSEIVDKLEENPSKIFRDLKNLMKSKEIGSIEIPKEEAMARYGCKRRMRLYYLVR